MLVLGVLLVVGNTVSAAIKATVDTDEHQAVPVAHRYIHGVTHSRTDALRASGRHRALQEKGFAHADDGRLERRAPYEVDGRELSRLV
jgi:hypothetical protein